ncbi:hypothetical protein RQP46_002001 [Phenoliferia psychrophenolica]
MLEPNAPPRRYSILGYELPSVDDLLALLPTPQLVLRSAVLGALLLSSVFISLMAWIIFYKAVGVKPGVTEVVWFQYGHARPPYADLLLSPLVVAEQAYDVKLELTVPTSTRNVELGNFMVNLALVNGAGTTTHNVSRPSTLHYRSPLSQTLSTLSPLSLLSLRSADVQQITVPLIESTVLRSRRAGRIYEAKIKFQAKMRGLSYIIYRYPILSFLLFIPSFLFFELLAAGAIWGAFVVRANPDTTAGITASSMTSSSSQGTEDFKIKSEDDEEDSQASTTTSQTQRFRRPRMEGESEEGEEEDDEDEDRTTESGTDESTGWDAVKPEDMEGDGATTAGSRTSRGTFSTFGPSVASTGASTSTSA